MNPIHQNMHISDEKAFSTGVYNEACYGVFKVVYYSKYADRFEFVVDDGEQDVKFTRSYAIRNEFGNSLCGSCFSQMLPSTKTDGEVCLKYQDLAWLPFYSTNPNEYKKRIYEDMIFLAKWIMDQMKSKRCTRGLRTMGEKKLRKLKLRFAYYEAHFGGVAPTSYFFTTTVNEIRMLANIIIGNYTAYTAEQIATAIGHPINVMAQVKETMKRTQITALANELKVKREANELTTAECSDRMSKFMEKTFPELDEYRLREEMFKFGFMGITTRELKERGLL